jgi:phosphoglycerate dehydrogenase-like enzyme
VTDDKLRVHVKNNRWAAGSFPNTPEGEEVFTITAERFDEIARRHPDLASKLDVTVDWDTDNFAASMASTDVLLTWNLPTQNLGAVAPKLKWIHIIGAGVEHLTPMDWVPDGVIVTNNKGVHAAKAGEYGLMSILMLHTSMPRFQTFQRTHHYESVYSTPIVGRTVLIVGVGSIGRAVAGHLKRLGLTVLGVTRHGGAMDEVDEMHMPDALDALLPRADYVFVATPLTEETRNLLDARRLDLMKPGAGLVNIGREPVVDYRALAERLESGHLSGAILDVFEPEPIEADSYLWDVPNLIVTPHISADDGDAYVPQTLELFFANLRKLMAGEDLGNLVRPDIGY